MLHKFPHPHAQTSTFHLPIQTPQSQLASSYQQNAMARVRNPPRNQPPKQYKIPAKHLNILLSLIKHSRRATHVAAKPTTPATTMDISPTIHPPPRCQRRKKDKRLAQHIAILRSIVTRLDKASHVATKPYTPTTTTVNEPNTNQVSNLIKPEHSEVPNGANGSKDKTPEPPGESTPNIPTASTHPSKKEPAKPPTNSTSNTVEPTTPPHPPTDSNRIFLTIIRFITLYALFLSLRTLIEFLRHLLLPDLNPNDFWYRMLVQFSTGFIITRYRRLVERYLQHIRVALFAYYLYGLVREGLRLEMFSGRVSLGEVW
ncbi:hypothetical protein BDR22DRAFT_831705 [Usnea florida]